MIKNIFNIFLLNQIQHLKKLNLNFQNTFPEN